MHNKCYCTNLPVGAGWGLEVPGHGVQWVVHTLLNGSVSVNPWVGDEHGDQHGNQKPSIAKLSQPA